MPLIIEWSEMEGQMHHAFAGGYLCAYAFSDGERWHARDVLNRASLACDGSLQSAKEAIEQAIRKTLEVPA